MASKINKGEILAKFFGKFNNCFIFLFYLFL